MGRPETKGLTSTHAPDVADVSAMRAFSNAVLSTHLRIDLLVSNAGGLREIDFTHEDLQSLDLTPIPAPTSTARST